MSYKAITELIDMPDGNGWIHLSKPRFREPPRNFVRFSESVPADAGICILTIDQCEDHPWQCVHTVGDRHHWWKIEVGSGSAHWWHRGTPK